MTPNPQSCVPPGHVRARRSVVAALLVAAVGTSGCKMMTEAQLQVRQQEQARLERKSASEEKNAARLQEVDQAQQQLTLRIQDRDARRDRMGRFEEARRAFDGGDPAGAIAIVDDVFAADQESIALYEAARAEGNTIEFLSTVELVEDEKATADPVTGEKPTIEKLVVTPTPMTDEDEAMFYVLRGGAHYTSGNREQGLADFRTATELDPGNRVARINLGKLLFEQHEWEGALAAWKTELEDGYRSAELLELIGQALFELAKEKDDPSLIEASRQALMEAFVATPQKESLVRWLGRLEYYCERYEEAIRYFEGVLARHPLDPTYLEYLANAQLELDRYREAADTFELLVRVSEGEDLQRVQLSLVGLYAQLRLPDRAATWLRRAYEGRTMPSESQFDLVLFLSSAEQLEAAIAAADAISTGAAEYAEAQGIAAEMEIALRRFDVAAARLESLVGVAPGNGQFHLSAGDLAMQRKQFETALRYFNLAAAIPDTKARGLASAAEAYYELGNLAKAIDYYEDALAAAPENAAYLAALGEIQNEHEFRQSVAKESQP
ncbi:MAG: tetratricopeptide repeat protein [Planctomycetota bacterium]|jgi:tetratricopeptide (TPR) repeat protein